MSTRYPTDQCFNIIFNHIESAIGAINAGDTEKAIRLIEPLLSICAEQGLSLNSSDIGSIQWHRFVAVIAEKYPAETE